MPVAWWDPRRRKVKKRGVGDGGEGCESARSGLSWERASAELVRASSCLLLVTLKCQIFLYPSQTGICSWNLIGCLSDAIFCKLSLNVPQKPLTALPASSECGSAGPLFSSERSSSVHLYRAVCAVRAFCIKTFRSPHSSTSWSIVLLPHCQFVQGTHRVSMAAMHDSPGKPR